MYTNMCVCAPRYKEVVNIGTLNDKRRESHGWSPLRKYFGLARFVCYGRMFGRGLGNIFTMFDPTD